MPKFLGQKPNGINTKKNKLLPLNSRLQTYQILLYYYVLKKLQKKSGTLISVHTVNSRNVWHFTIGCRGAGKEYY